ncbi:MULTISPECIES: TetR/AcrR family transcriptional regulator [unclassified Streptomyces]|uniref:TetR/AcrR family transcriptional regulator n=1 Tax=unclassified Streptomyces TaxID=2593676 RepID=UPI0016606985|nr:MULTISPECIES: TetR/AcrR family transcriptional regulator [unclassified Streptomyces]MBD0711511.1 TetR family transcriptional regulator [Streptomyces sp. CBMA291]MBD0716515.1 TetR family transcriptional regulator [Streptomyces sp. CBMA370]
MEDTASAAPAASPADPAPRRGRPRDAGRDRALLDATLGVLAESGYGALTTAAVAARAGVSTATLYRRWSSKEELVVAAAASLAEDPYGPPATGGLEGDLRVVLRDKVLAVTGEGGRLMRALIGEAAHNATLAEALTTAFLAPVYRRVAEVVRLAADRGEIPPVEDAELLGEIVVGPVMARFLLTPRPPERLEGPEAQAAADRFLPFALRAVGGGDRGRTEAARD